MDDDQLPDTRQDDFGASHRARTFVVRWWQDRGGPDEERLRGTVRDLAGTSLGAFSGFDALVSLLRRHFPADRDG